MSTKLDAQKVANFQDNNPSAGKNLESTVSSELSKEHRKGSSELEAMGASGKSYNAQVKDSPLQVRVKGYPDIEFSGYATKIGTNGFSTFNKQDKINANHSIESNIDQLSNIFDNKDFYAALAKVRVIHSDLDGKQSHDYKYADEDVLETTMRTIYSQFISEDNSQYYGDLAVRMLDGHFGMFDVNANNYTSNTVHSAIISCLDPLNKEKLCENINIAISQLVQSPYRYEEKRIVTGGFARKALDENDESLHYAPHLSTIGQGANNLHFDMVTMLALQAERWGLDTTTAHDPSFRDNLKNTMVQWAETVYASRALKMLEAQDEGRLSKTGESKFALSADDANWLQEYINKNKSSELEIEDKTANALNENHIKDAINDAKNAGKDNTDSVLNKGYNIKDNGESLEREASIEWKKQAVKAIDYVKSALSNWKDGRTSANQASDAVLIRSAEDNGLSV